MSKDPESIFLDNFKITDSKSCWIWIGSRYGNGYGQFWTGTKMTGAHRFSYEYYNDISIPKGLCVCHKCDNPSCVNPSHLFLGTQKDNMVDMVKKGRANPRNHGVRFRLFALEPDARPFILPEPKINGLKNNR